MKRIQTLKQKTKLIIFFLFITGWLSSCGMKTSPKALPEPQPASTLSDFRAQFIGTQIRLSWKTNQTIRSNILAQNSLQKEQNDFFEIRLKILPPACLHSHGVQECEGVLKAVKRVSFSSKNILHEKNRFIYYFQNENTNIQPYEINSLSEFQIKHLTQNGISLSSVLKETLYPKEGFPEIIPQPALKIVQKETLNQVLQYPFGTVSIYQLTNTEKSLKEINAENDNQQTNQSDKENLNLPILAQIKYKVRLSWKKSINKLHADFKGIGDFFENYSFFGVNIYRTENSQEWPESPINSKALHVNGYLDTLSTKVIRELKATNLADTHPNIFPKKLPFYIDFLGLNKDTWWFKLRLVDQFGNESQASKTVPIELPDTRIFGHIVGKLAFIPASN